MWPTICDMSVAVAAIKANTVLTCDTLVIDFSTMFTSGLQSMQLNFAGLSSLPTGFRDCNTSGSIITIVDKNNVTHSVNVSISTLVYTGNTFDIPLSGTKLDLTGNLTVKLNGCFTNGTLNCNKNVTKTVAVPTICGNPTNLQLTIGSLNDI